MTGGNPINTSNDYNEYTWDESKTSAIGSEWFTLSKDEWDYITTNTGRGKNRYVKATVGGVDGLMLFPDDYSGPTIENMNLPAVKFGVFREWSSAESDGAVFFPFSANRIGTQVTTGWTYWLSTEFVGNTLGRSCDVYVNSGFFYSGPGPRSTGLPVRLVRSL